MHPARHGGSLARRSNTRSVDAAIRGRVVLPAPETHAPRTIAFVRGQGTSDDVQIDHVVALSAAWQKGAQGWDTATRTAFANDPLNPLAVDGPLNQQKGDGDAATWLPPKRAYRCTYVARLGGNDGDGLACGSQPDAGPRTLRQCPP